MAAQTLHQTFEYDRSQSKQLEGNARKLPSPHNERNASFSHLSLSGQQVQVTHGCNCNTVRPVSVVTSRSYSQWPKRETDLHWSSCGLGFDPNDSFVSALSPNLALIDTAPTWRWSAEGVSDAARGWISMDIPHSRSAPEPRHALGKCGEYTGDYVGCSGRGWQTSRCLCVPQKLSHVAKLLLCPLLFVYP